MDGRWLLLSLLVAAIAAVRWRRRAPRDESSGAGGTPRTGLDNPATPPVSAPRPPAPRPDAGPPPDAPTYDTWAQGRMDAQLDAQLDRSRERTASGPGDDARSPGREVPPPGQPDGILGIEGIDAALDRVWAEHAGAADTLLDARLRLIVHRGIPARAIRPAPGTRTIRVVFADGTILLCRGTGQGDFGRLGLALQQHRSVRLGSFAREAGGTRLEFRWHPDHRLAAVAVGLDQPD